MDFVKQEYQIEINERNVYLEDLKNIIIQTSNYLEGNCFYHHMTLNEFPELYSKQLNLFWCGKQAISNICEIGFNAGHSSIFLNNFTKIVFN
jgi:hypothetical protein